jgi:hypothetical protein
MKKQISVLLIILMLAGFSWAQGTKPSFDVNKSQEELEIMRGILSTTLSFVLQKSETEKSRAWRFTNINAFYLAGQGAVFVIPTSNLPGRMNEVSENISELSTRLATQYLGLSPFAALDQAKDEPNYSVRSAPTEMDREKLRKKIEESQLQLKKARETAEANRAKFTKELDAVKAYLVETLANYGDSMTTIRPNEYINFVLTDDGVSNVLLNLNEKRTRTDIISAEKSWVTDYKGGRLSMDGFKQKVLQYSE